MQSYMGNSKNEILGETPPDNDMIDGFPLYYCIFAIYYN